MRQKRAIDLVVGDQIVAPNGTVHTVIEWWSNADLGRGIVEYTTDRGHRFHGEGPMRYVEYDLLEEVQGQ